MPEKFKKAAVFVAIAAASAVLGALQTFYGVDLGLCPEVQHIGPVEVRVGETVVSDGGVQ
jgi:hypothetical protein